jgi:hypothetical protein
MSPASSLEELIGSVREKAVRDTPIAQLAKASEYAGSLNRIGDLLLDHFVHECRKAEMSWAELSSALAVSKPPANPDVIHDRVPDKVVEHTPRTQDAVSSGKTPFSRRSKNLLQAILDEAVNLGHLWSNLGISGHREPGRPLM